MNDYSEPQAATWKLDLGACVLDPDQVAFRVWAPFAKKVELITFDSATPEKSHKMELENESSDYYARTIDAKAGTRYFYFLDETRKRADPASRFQPEGVHGPSEVIDPSAFHWSDGTWSGIDIEDLMIYELHVGTYAEAGNFESVIPYINYLRNELGVTAIELMPVSQFPGDRNWGYDGVFMYSPQNTYGGPRGLKNLINSCHTGGLAVILDVVYNHIGPEGNYLQEFGPYFSHKYKTPWGPGLNYDDRGCDGVRKYIISNALYWIREFHLDGLRLDAVHSIFDFSPKSILQEIGEAVHKQEQVLHRKINVIAESDLNDTRITRSTDNCGYGLDSQWSDDFHHSVHAYLTSERFGYYQDFGSLEEIQKAMLEGFVYDGRFSSFRGRKHGESSVSLPGKKFVICLQNHDQVGNRPDGLRLSQMIGDLSMLKVAAALLVLSPYIPLFFMGEEYGESSPFYYFVSHTDPKLVEAVREGRRKEFESHNWSKFSYVDPQDRKTFEKSKLDHNLRTMEPNRELLSYYSELIRMRTSHAALKTLEKKNLDVRCFEKMNTLVIRRRAEQEDLRLVYVLGDQKSKLDGLFQKGVWRKIHDSVSLPSKYGSASSSAPEEISAGEKPVVFPPHSLTIYSCVSV